MNMPLLFHLSHRLVELTIASSWQAMEWITQRGVVHLVVDLPSIDMQHDVAPSFQALCQTSGSATLTSRTVLGRSLSDGLYMVSLNPSAMVHHTIPSTPLLYKLYPSGVASQDSARGSSTLALHLGPVSDAGQESLEEIRQQEERARQTVPSYMSVEGRRDAHETMRARQDVRKGSRKGAYPRGNSTLDPRATAAGPTIGSIISSPAQRIRMGAAAVHRNLSEGFRSGDSQKPMGHRDMSIKTVSTATPMSPAQRYSSSRANGEFAPSMQSFEEGSPSREDIGVRLNKANFLQS